ncbi:MAG: M23 family metallopeptidase, partial [Desulfuromonadaceae bacterium]
PFVSLVNFGGTYLLMYLLSRDDYTYPCHPKNKKFHLNWWLYSTLMGAASGLTGSLLVWAMSRTVDWKEFGKEIGNGAFQSWLLFMITQYGSKEGDTDDGKYNPTRNADGVAYTPARQPFAGYPPHTTSPYKLPYVKDKSLYVVQGNQGMFSHTRFNPTATLYAYDIAHDFGDEVLAARAGTVVDFYDWIDDDINPNSSQKNSAFTQSETDMSAGWRGTNKPAWNFIIIRHDSQNAEHDKGPNGTAVTTYAIYGHGKQGSIRAAFLAHSDSKAPGDILGTTVQQGQPIMQGGDTGNSIMNHLHMQVMGGPATAPAGSITRLDQLTDYTLPFVFREQKGALQSLTWYKSDNERVN